MLPNMDMYHAEFGAISISGAEGWSAQTAEASLDSRVGVEEDEETQSTRNAILAEKNTLAKQMLEQVQLERKYNVENVVEVLNGLHGVTMWYPFHVTAVDHLLANEANRRGFLAFSSEEDKNRYLDSIVWHWIRSWECLGGGCHRWKGVGGYRCH
ncbi:hypothetical protein CARUB_v10014828mg [Capsella rubella]|uniref:Uncharacterized protein n=1 Tax=Capsella rubella TaxID=81985 RepID=R0HPD6_9BRAS|nr:hypothetical protein CARUB_v10014828mg [Capsella rubella]